MPRFPVTLDASHRYPLTDLVDPPASIAQSGIDNTPD